MSKYAKYADLVAATTSYGKKMKVLSSRIFGEVAKPTTSPSMKVVKLFQKKPLPFNKDITEYYPRHYETHYFMLKLRDYGLFRDEHEDFRQEMKRLRALRGKAPPPRPRKHTTAPST